MEEKAPQIVDEVSAEIEKAKLAAKQQRQQAISSLLDQATDVLSEMLSTTDRDHESARMRAAELAINLYVQQESGERQDRSLDLQQKRLDVEVAKLSRPGQPLFQQNNLYLDNNGVPSPNVPKTPEEKQRDQDLLLARKRAQNALLATYLPPQVDPEKSQLMDIEEDSDSVLSDTEEEE